MSLNSRLRRLEWKTCHLDRDIFVDTAPSEWLPNKIYYIKDTGKIVVTDADGNQTEYGADTPIDYDKLDNYLRQTITLPNSANIDIDFDSAVAFAVEIQQDTTFTFSNVRENKQIKLILKGDHAVTLTGVNTSDVNYDGARWNVIIIEATLIESNLTLKAVSWV